MRTPRWLAAAAPLPDGRVLVAGGRDRSSYLSSAEIFDPATQNFSSAGIGSMGTPPLDAVAAPLPNGRVLVAGGSNGSVLSSAEVFVPATVDASTPPPSSTAPNSAPSTSTSPTSTQPSNAFSFSLIGKTLKVRVQAPGKVAVSPVPNLIKASGASGDPPTITVALKLTKQAKKALKLRGRLKVKTRITFTPVGGTALTKTAKLTLKSP